MKNVKLTKDNCKILICCHKECELPPDLDKIFLPIQVGANISSVDLGFQRDDKVNGETCDNISDKNKSFCELTAVYWAWKNIKKLYPDLEYIGLNHYRRYFTFDRKNFFDDAVICRVSEVKDYTLDLHRVEKILARHNAIMAKQRVYPYPLEIDYSACHVSEDMRTLKKIIHDKYPEYDKDVYSVMTCNGRLSPYNMNVIGWDQFDSYCSWLFDILLEAERQINIEHYNAVQGRIFGYMAERLFNIWVHHNLKSVKFLNIVKFDDTVYKKPTLLGATLRCLRTRISLRCMTPIKKNFSEEVYCRNNGWNK